ncbi:MULTISPECIES: RHS repeat-associated core domain-containing protein [Pseudescherichia]|jgi:RHS repeat-associated protein|uniref:RHS repeat-associated core domain-containing protein n=1 Tax=Pseudescherichia TaxID=2055880 RepID=UPI002899C29D|nr:RHS repeat-associated core domain-containing protein [Pseudescherichia sp.]
MSLQLTGTNQANSTLLAYDGNTQQVNIYSAFGDVNNTQSGQLPGFNGERPDPFTGVTHLGNGYRAYNPVLMRFNCPDNDSPFGVGGINPYAYCENDPVNFRDPSGHGIFKLIIRGLTFLFRHIFEEKMAIAMAKGVAKTTKYMLTYGTLVTDKVTKASAYLVADNNPAAAAKLEKASQAFGYIYSTTSLYGNVDKIYKNVKKLVSRNGVADVDKILQESYTPLDNDGERMKLPGGETGESTTDALVERVESATQKGLRLLEEGAEALPEYRGDFVRPNLSTTPVYQITVSSLSITSTVLSYGNDIAAKKGNEEAAMALGIMSETLDIAKYIFKAPKYINRVKSIVSRAQSKIYSDGISSISYKPAGIKLKDFGNESTFI